MKTESHCLPRYALASLGLACAGVSISVAWHTGGQLEDAGQGPFWRAILAIGPAAVLAGGYCFGVAIRSGQRVAGVVAIGLSLAGVGLIKATEGGTLALLAASAEVDRQYVEAVARAEVDAKNATLQRSGEIRADALAAQADLRLRRAAVLGLMNATRLDIAAKEKDKRRLEQARGDARPGTTRLSLAIAAIAENALLLGAARDTLVRYVAEDAGLATSSVAGIPISETIAPVVIVRPKVDAFRAFCAGAFDEFFSLRGVAWFSWAHILVESLASAGSGMFGARKKPESAKKEVKAPVQEEKKPAPAKIEIIRPVLPPLLVIKAPEVPFRSAAFPTRLHKLRAHSGHALVSAAAMFAPAAPVVIAEGPPAPPALPRASTESARWQTVQIPLGGTGGYQTLPPAPTAGRPPEVLAWADEYLEAVWPDGDDLPSRLKGADNASAGVAKRLRESAATWKRRFGECAAVTKRVPGVEIVGKSTVVSITRAEFERLWREEARKL